MLARNVLLWDEDSFLFEVVLLLALLLLAFDVDVVELDTGVAAPPGHDDGDDETNLFAADVVVELPSLLLLHSWRQSWLMKFSLFFFYLRGISINFLFTFFEFLKYFLVDV